MKLTSAKLRIAMPPPQQPLNGMNVLDLFAAPDYALESEGAWLRVTHVESGKSRRYPLAHVMAADEAPSSSEQPKFSKHMQGGKR